MTLVPKFFFDIDDGTEVRDDAGMDLPNLSAARDRVIELAAGFVSRREFLEQEGGAMVITVRNADRGETLSLRLACTLESN